LQIRAIVELHTNNGAVFSFGSGAALGHKDSSTKLKPTVISLFKMQQQCIVQVATSCTHALALGTDKLSLFGWGSGQPELIAHNQLNQPDYRGQREPARVVTAGDDVKPQAHAQFVAIACGNRHNVAVNQDGEVT
jgi:alpha-tubulin suppressor-like RCC1 family protein